jgi:TPR repeat protein
MHTMAVEVGTHWWRARPIQNGDFVNHLRTVCAILLCVISLQCRAASVNVPTEQETLSLLSRDAFSELDDRFTAIQKAYDENKISDETLRDAFRVFYATDPQWESHYQKWVLHSDKVYVAHLARGIYYKKVGLQKRGGEVISRTSQQQVDGMTSAFRIAAMEFKASLALEKRPLLTYLHSMDIAMSLGTSESVREILDRAIAIDPYNFVVREKYMGSLQVRWGGSVPMMRAFLAECRKAGLSAAHLKTLQALVLEEEAWNRQYIDGNKDAAVRDYRQAAKLDPASACQPCGPLQRAADLLFDQAKYQEAIPLYTQLLKADPKNLRALENRAFAELWLKKVDASEADYLAAAKLGDVYAQGTLGRMYYFGVDVPKDPDKAFYWVKMAADQGDSDSIKLLPYAQGLKQRSEATSQ